MIEKDTDQRDNKISYETLGKDVEKCFLNPGNGAGKIILDVE